MKRHFYFRTGIALFVITLATLYFSLGRHQVQVVASSHKPKIAQMGCSTPSFAAAPTSPEPVGLDAHYVGVGYVNGDSHLDIVTTDNDSASLTILLGDGTGNFTATTSTPFAVGVHPVTVEIGEFNHDGKSDLVVTNEGSNSLSILLGDGTGNFTNALGSPMTVGTFPRAVAIGNFNGDAHSDFVVSNGGSDNLSILLGNGNGTFTAAAGSPVAAGDAAFHTVIGHFNADAFEDLAVANLGDGTVTIFLGNGAGGFTQFGAAIPVGTFTAFLALGDFNGDSKTDLAAVNRVSANLVVFLGNGNGGFSQAPGSPYPVGLAPMAVATGDLNLDGTLDLAVANESGANTNILLGNGDGTFTQSAIVTKGQLPTHMALADFNEDSKLDIATSDAGDNTVTILLNTCSACTAIAINPATTSSGIAGSSYSEIFTGSDGTPPYSLALSGALPNGLSFNDPILSGTPTQTGSFPITATATDSNGCIGTRNYTLVINCQNITVNPATLPNGFVGISYGKQTLSATGGIAPYTFTVSAGALPSGVTLSGGALSGTPTTGGTFNFTIQAADNNGCVGTRAYTVIISGGAKGTGLQFYPLAAPVRLLDTRSGATGCFTPGAKIPGNTSRRQSVAGSCSIPTTAQAVTGNITTVQSGGGYLTLYSSDATKPTVANSNYSPNEVLNNAFTVGLGAADGAFKIFVTTNTDVVVDITGYYAPPGAGGLYFHPLPKPIRLLETRTGQPGCSIPGTPLPGNVDTVQQGTTTCSGVIIPSTAQALFGNATTANPVTGGFLTFFQANAARPPVASGNYSTGQILNSPFTVGLSPAGQFKIFTTAQTDLVIDVQGYYSADAVDVNGQGLLLTPLPTPVRLLDTRAGFSGCFTPGTPLQAAVEQSQLARGTCTIGASAQAIIGNATVVNDPAQGFLTLWPSNTIRPLAASSNWIANQIFNRYFTVGLGGDGKFKMYASSGTHLVVDVSGYFAP